MLNVQIDEKRFTPARGESLLTINGLRFEVAAGRFTCLVGPSGCGKSTTLRIILGLDTDYNGVVTKQHSDRIAAVFQEPRLLPWRTVRENVELCLHDSDIKKESLQELFEILELQELADFYPAELSLGLARRVAIARAFATEPGVLILDEPFVSLDNNTANTLRKLLLQVWQQRPTTVLMVTHNVEEAAMLADNVLVMAQRPTRVLADIPIETARTERDSETLGKISQAIETAKDS